MKRLFQSVLQNRMFRANVIMVGGNFFANIGAYFYHLLMGRMLIPGDYGALQSLISLSNIFAVPMVTLSIIITKHIAGYVGRGEYGKISYFFHRLEKNLLITCLFGGFLFLLFSRPILAFLHIDSWVNFVFLDIMLFFGLFKTLNLATIQGLSQFVHLTINQFIEAYGKLLLGVIAVSLGLRVPGAFGAFVLIYFVSYGFTTYMVKRFLVKKETPVRLSIRSMTTYGVFSFFMTISMISLFNADVILVRHFFSSYDSGLYAALSVLGKIIFFGSAPVSIAMLPLVSEAYERKEGYHRIFLQSLIIIIGIAAVATTMFSLYSSFALQLLVGKQYIAAAPYLMLFSIFISICTIINLFVTFFLSIYKKFPMYIMLVAALTQIVLIFFVHPNLSTVILISLSTVSILSIILFGYYVATAKK